MKDICYNMGGVTNKSFISFFKSLEKEYAQGVILKNNAIHFDNDFLKGWIEFISVNEEIGIYKFHCRCSKGQNFKRIVTSKPTHYIFYFFLGEGTDAHFFDKDVNDNELHPFRFMTKHSVFYCTSNVPSFYKVLPDRAFKDAIAIIIPVELLDKEMSLQQKSAATLLLNAHGTSVFKGYADMNIKVIDELNELFDSDNYPLLVRNIFLTGVVYQVLARLFHTILQKNVKLMTTPKDLDRVTRMVQIRNLLIDRLKKLD